MEQHLRCNNQQGGSCRAALTAEAIATTCAHVPPTVILLLAVVLIRLRHIFCIPCAEKTGLSTAPRNQRRCPVCKTALPNAHDAVRNLINPPEDFKTSLLCGLDPATIMECAQTALSFWTYQKAQELAYQQHIAKNLTHRFHQLNAEVERTVNDGNSRIQALETQNQQLSTDVQSLQQKYTQLYDQYQDKSRKQAQTQKLYDTLKQKVMLEKMEPLAKNDPFAHKTLPRQQKGQLLDMGAFKKVTNDFIHTNGPGAVLVAAKRGACYRSRGRGYRGSVGGQNPTYCLC
ncbi:hypothetical protein Z517_05123 [Fonsecaea pedrosoi CBS 271.37]|uniref:Unplaced genomic scaffold supercont1.3, whole genome shotgun sequence n=1 Tax=Fonsecaea pedrosoi CBS 271.37 TaxID=1442368 RepID=A0A0D2DWB5_9EURO|nr:uncharacterized protein Z517_05123 [Fonsecaea pedrosoi CBS 271.37]KIW82096.1 hypothetical protein Z517_05123 [Fonsecaea pedrosoi CBS 271.37]